MASAEFQEHTLMGSAICAGVGVHTGVWARLAVRPAPAGSGVIFVRTDIQDRDNRIPALSENVTQTRLGTVIANAAGVTVSTIEHLMAALSALGVDNALIELDGPEVPILDGSALPFVQLLDRAGFRRQHSEQFMIEVLKPVTVERGDKRASLLPSSAFEVYFEIEFASRAVGRQVIDLTVTEDSFRNELAAARTFGFAHEVEALRAAGLARGGSLENAVVIEGDEIINPEGLRFADEFVRHKALDAIGDLYILGMPLLARYEGVRAGHEMNNLIVRALLADPSAYRVVSRAPALAQAG